jgi:hypothetical protein
MLRCTDLWTSNLFYSLSYGKFDHTQAYAIPSKPVTTLCIAILCIFYLLTHNHSEQQNVNRWSRCFSHNTDIYSIRSDTEKTDVPILAIITGHDPTGKQVHLHSKPHHMTERPAKKPPDWLQWLQKKEFNLSLYKWSSRAVHSVHMHSLCAVQWKVVAGSSVHTVTAYLHVL